MSAAQAAGVRRGDRQRPVGLAEGSARPPAEALVRVEVPGRAAGVEVGVAPVDRLPHVVGAPPAGAVQAAQVDRGVELLAQNGAGAGSTTGGVVTALAGRTAAQSSRTLRSHSPFPKSLT